ncbi:MAG: molybdopterin molybdotransferase MoeA [Lunatimonas sp.]|uniref:molybdopterin molybdotransferase MoeA n=1 Tax=Lunatimonas sp. TaxID=2060141 RepID=UPI00263B2320|nr:molybdopterin molybdotransferase MoeA [Lunatimonas sp.]MCC5938833.1 molybdopterin molybdotransferase MoeA [Lunatimonas sp.]
MISVKQALEIINNQPLPLGFEEIPIHLAVGRILAVDVLADRDAPPFDRVTMDGVAIQAAHFKPGFAYQIAGTQAAGGVPQSIKDPSHCLEVMTGAMLPMGADCVIPYEQVTIRDGYATLQIDAVAPYLNIHRKGMDTIMGNTLIPKGSRLSAGKIGVMAAVGVSKATVACLPKVIVCSTGDELIPIEKEPLPHQIRNSNASMLQAALNHWGIRADSIHLPDEKSALSESLAKLKESYDIWMFSGAVSKGKFDYLPEVLQELGMNSLIHGVAQRPGKPFLFGAFDHSIVFGFPGNPASTLICFHTFFTPWLATQQGSAVDSMVAELDADIVFKKPLTYHLLVSIRHEGQRVIASPVANSGSGDLIHLGAADGFVSLPPDTDTFSKGQMFPLTRWSNVW